eukprot:Clim_evm70s88 gene=Clim_evmTU70s88
MSRRRGPQSTANTLEKTLKKAQTKLDNEEFYEAHQVYRTVYHRYKAAGSFKEAIELGYRGALALLEVEQWTSGGDLALLVTEGYQNLGLPVDDEMKNRLLSLFKASKKDTVERRRLFHQSIQWSIKCGRNTRGDEDLQYWAGKIEGDSGNFSTAMEHLIMGGDEGAAQLVQVLIAWSQAANPDEYDMILAKAVFDYLLMMDMKHANNVYEGFLMTHPRRTEPNFVTPLMNFLKFMLLTCERDAAPLWRVLKQKYQGAISRDPEFMVSVESIGQIYFGERPQQNPMQALMQQFMGGMLGPQAPPSAGASSSGAASDPMVDDID